MCICHTLCGPEYSPNDGNKETEHVYIDNTTTHVICLKKTVIIWSILIILLYHDYYHVESILTSTTITILKNRFKPEEMAKASGACCRSQPKALL